MARGIHFGTMGHSVPRPAPTNELGHVQKRLELLPEEAIYLIERSALFCWKENPLLVSNDPALHDVDGSPMSVQQAYTEMIGKEDLTLEKYQVRLPSRQTPQTFNSCLGFRVSKTLRIYGSQSTTSFTFLPNSYAIFKTSKAPNHGADLLCLSDCSVQTEEIIHSDLQLVGAPSSRRLDTSQ
jgi:hypothetical protein